jgi:hypothetical protein
MGEAMKKLIFSLGLVLLFVSCKETPTTSNAPEIFYRSMEIRFFQVRLPEIMRGESAVLSWATINARSVSIDQGIGEVEASGSRIVKPGEGTTYTLTAQGMKGRASRSVTVWVIQPE